MHCSDEDLIAYLDGETGAIRRFRIRRHLKTCWNCRGRMADLEQQIHELAKSLDEWPYPDAHTQMRVKFRLNERMRREGIEGRTERRVWTPGRGRWVPAWSAAALALLIAGWAVTTRVREPEAKEWIARAAAGEALVLENGPIEQDFKVELVELRPAARSITRQLNVRWDGRTGRFSARWADSGGTLRHALWRSGPGAEQVYSAAAGGTARGHLRYGLSAPLSSVALAGDSDPEPAFVRWLESREWGAITLASELAVWSRAKGTILEAVDSDDAGFLRIIAKREEQAGTAIMSLEIRKNTARPRLQTIRVETAARAIEYRIAPTGLRRIEAEGLADVFQPGVPRGAPPAARIQAERPLLDPAENGVSLEAQPDVAHTVRMAEARYVLHRAGACLGNPVEITQDGGQVRVRNRRSDGHGIDILTPTALEDVLGALAEYRSRSSIPAEIPRLVRSDALPPTLLLQAAALRHLSRVFPERETERLPAAALQLVESMVREHVESLRAEARRLGLEPLDRPAGHHMIRRWRESAATIYDKITTLREMAADERTAEVNSLSLEIELEIASATAAVRREFARVPAGATARRRGSQPGS